MANVLRPGTELSIYIEVAKNEGPEEEVIYRRHTKMFYELNSIPEEVEFSLPNMTTLTNNITITAYVDWTLDDGEPFTMMQKASKDELKS